MINFMKNNSKMSQNYVNILGIKVLSTTTSSLLAGVEDKIAHSSKFIILTPNPELVLASQSDKKLKKALNSADFSIPDGVGLKLADPSLKIIKGRELFLDLIKLAATNKWKVFLLGGLSSEAELAVQKLESCYRNLKIESDKGPTLDNNAEPVSEEGKKIEINVIAQINEFKPQLLFVAFGNPKQEIWIQEHLSRLNIGGAMAVGGAFRYVAGLSKLPPKWISQIGLEWLYRLVTEPRRLGRIFNAVVVFPLKVFLSKFISI
jgi:N-acetylglucosaminyldiphosphoundecaprenol N-acetyl-beta-D-mannosaminyltransferase